MKLKDILPFSTILNTLKNKKLWNKLLVIIYPLISVTIILNVILVIMGFVFFEVPDNWYIPFMGGKVQGVFDRIIIVIGIVLMFFDKDK